MATIATQDLKPGMFIAERKGYPVFEVLEVKPGQWANRDAKPSSDGSGLSIAERDGDVPDFYTVKLDSHIEPKSLLQSRIDVRSLMAPNFQWEVSA